MRSARSPLVPEFRCAPASEAISTRFEADEIYSRLMSDAT
jgi:hypothetical protein